MDYDKSNDIGKNEKTISVNLSAGDKDIKYYNSDGDNCVFEIVDKECNTQENKKNKDILEDKILERSNIDNGKIEVKTFLDCGKKEVLEGVKVNLYKINGLSPLLIKTGLTDSNGKIVFSNIEEGNYRVIEIINKKYFQKPKYIDWNEITINEENKDNKIVVINKVKDKYVKYI